MGDQPIQRRLAAILAADVAGYTRLMERDTDGTVAAWQAARKEVIKPTVADHSGKIVKLTGDGFLVEFSTVQDAVNCAIAMQRGLASSPLDFRIGVNLGDIVDDGEDIHGEGVNVAARLEGLADPGGICISGDVYNQVRNRVDAVFEDMGRQDVKNVSAPLQAYAVRLDSPAVPSASGAPAGPAISDKPSIAVLAFDNLSGDPEQEYFADGMAEDIITGLSHFRSLFVIARSSSFTYKGRAVDVTQVARELGVRYVLEGSVRKAGNRVRVTAQLIDATTGHHIWAERYDRELDDIFALQDEITETIVASIEPELGAVEREMARRKPPNNLDAWDSYQRGLSHLYGELTGEEMVKAKRWLRRACELDPAFAAAFGELAWLHTIDIILGSTDDPETALDEAARAAEKAVALDARDSGARAALGRVYIFRQTCERAIAELETALTLNPSFDRGHYVFGMALLYSGRPADSIPHFEQAIRLNPHGWRPWTYRQMLARAYLSMGQYVEAAAWSEKAIQYPSAPFLPFIDAATALGHLGRIDEARAMLTEVKKRKPDFSVDTVRNTIGRYGLHSGIDRIIDGLRKAGLPE